MTLDPAQSSNSNNVYQSGQNGNDNRTNQNNQPAENLQPSKHNQPSKARACNNKNIGGAKSKGFKLGKLARQTIRKNAYSQNGKNKLFIGAATNGDVKWVKKWLEAGADVNHANKNGITPLIATACFDHIEIVKLLLSRPEIDVNKTDVYDGETPLIAAACFDHIEIVKLLLSRPEIDVNLANSRGWTALFCATWNGHIDAVKELLSHPDIDVNKDSSRGWTALFCATWNGRVDAVKELLSHPDIDVNKATNNSGSTPLYSAAYYGFIEIVKLLLSHPDIDVNETDNNGQTPLYRAAQAGRVYVVKELLSHPGIDVDQYEDFLDYLVDNNAVDFIQSIVLNGCSKGVYEHLHNKASEADKLQLLEIFDGKLDYLMSGYANTKALGGHNKAYGKTKVPEDLLNIVINYLNPNLTKRQT
ncbi:MAG: hypothetical protein GY874_16220 [Desulfobacteraceae bacterium]|nr:hypothetical protein [Desulfobacteraceae bacterium]